MTGAAACPTTPVKHPLELMLELAKEAVASGSPAAKELDEVDSPHGALPPLGCPQFSPSSGSCDPSTLQRRVLEASPHC